MRFPSYSSEWHSYTLGEILTFYSTNSFSREKLNYDTGSVKNIHYGDIHTKFPSIVSIDNNKDIPFINDDLDLSKFSEDQYLREGDLIIADASEDYEDIGKAIEVKDINNEKVLAGLHTILARDENDMTVNGFKAYLFSTNNLKTKIKIIANGISVLGISKNNLSKLNVEIPSKKEQQNIVSFISDIDKKIELLEKKHQLYLDFKNYLMQQIFAQKLRFDFSDEWKIVKLESLIKKGKAGGTPSSTNSDYYNGDIPFLSIKDMTDQGKYIVKTEKTITEEGLNNSSAWIIPKNSLLYSIYASIGLVAINRSDISTSQAIYGIILKDGVSLEYMYYYLTYFKKNIHKYIETGTQGNLNAKLLKSFEILLPSLGEQEMIVNVLSIVDEKIENSKKEIEKINEFKKGSVLKLSNFFLFLLILFMDYFNIVDCCFDI